MMEALNRDCLCASLDAVRLRELVGSDTPDIFAALPVFASRTDVDAMARVIAAVGEAVALRGYRETVLARAPGIASFDSGALGVFAGYDFHLAADGPRLIEINTNAGGALLNAALGRAQRACCAEVAALEPGPIPAERLEEVFFEMFLAEWHRAGPQRPAAARGHRAWRSTCGTMYTPETCRCWQPASTRGKPPTCERRAVALRPCSPRAQARRRCSIQASTGCGW